MAVCGDNVIMDARTISNDCITGCNTACAISLHIYKVCIGGKNRFYRMVSTDIGKRIGSRSCDGISINNQGINIITFFRRNKVGFVASTHYRCRARGSDGAMKCRNSSYLILISAEISLYCMVRYDL